jgi:hypothetical protein
LHLLAGKRNGQHIRKIAFLAIPVDLNASVVQAVAQNLELQFGWQVEEAMEGWGVGDRGGGGGRRGERYITLCRLLSNYLDL